LFRKVRHRLEGWINALREKLGLGLTIFTIVTVLGLGSSVFTAIVAAIMLAEVVTLLKLDRAYEVKLTVYACYAIGLGAALTPLGEPLSTIVVAKLKGPPHNADFFYLIKQVGLWIVPGVLLCAALAARGASRAVSRSDGLTEDAQDSVKIIFIRSAKVYLFVMALIFLGGGLTPLADRFVARLPTWALYWANSVSAILDNATLAAAEISPLMTDRQITFILMGLLISGGMLIPGNIPNIISSAKLGIKSGEWAKAALPFGGALMLVYFVLMTLLVR
ncbi:MAG: cation transporter, partial [Elusimicrobia bacterium RIFCSPHIGHO2_02_FULL_61_10]